MRLQEDTIEGDRKGEFEVDKLSVSIFLDGF